MGYKGMNSPISINKVDNPLANGEKVKRARAGRDRAYAKTGLKSPKSPL